MNQNKTLSNSGWWIIPFLSGLPILFWAFGSPLQHKFSTLSAVVTNLGNIFGLSGFAMFALVLILSARLKFFENFFRGINESYTAHHFFGGIAFSLLLFHPLLLVYSYLQSSFREAALFFLPSSYWAQNFGIFGLLTMIITLGITFYAKIKYHVWKFTHKFMGVAFLLAFLHVFLIGSDVSSNQWLKAYLFLLSALAFTVYFYRSLFADYMVGVFSYKVAGIKAFQDKIWEIELLPNPASGREIKFLPGQFAFVRFLSSSLTKEAHPFSFSSAPGKPLKIAVKELGDYTNKIGSLKAGDLTLIEGPFGYFSFKNHANKKQVWIAGGVGITPFLSMLRSFASNNIEYDIVLYFSVKDKNSLAFSDEIKAIAERNSNFRVVFLTADTEGFISADAILKTVPDLNERDILICGPVPMMSALKEQFLQKGVEKEQIYIEEFQLY